MNRHLRLKIRKTFPRCLRRRNGSVPPVYSPGSQHSRPAHGAAGRVGFRSITLGNVFGSDLSSEKPALILQARHVPAPKSGPRGAPFAATVSFSQRRRDGDRSRPRLSHFSKAGASQGFLSAPHQRRQHKGAVLTSCCVSLCLTDAFSVNK